MANTVLKPRTFILADSFYKMEKNSTDVIIVGSSNAFSNINPAILWNNQGIASGIFGGSAQQLWNTYYYLKEVYKYQSPKLVVLEVYYAFMDAQYLDTNNAQTNTLGLNFSLNKMEAINASVPRSDFFNFLFGLPMYHTRYTELIQDPKNFFKTEDKFGSLEYGFYPVFLTTKIERPNVNFTDKAPIPSKSLKYLNMIIDFAKEHHSQILLLKTPNLQSQDIQNVYNSVGDLAKQRGIKFLDLNQHLDDLQLNFDLDFVDTVHLNDRGSKKVTDYLGNYIKENYSLPDRRGDKQYQSHENYSRLFYETGFKCPPIVSTVKQVLNKFDFTIPGQNGQTVVESYPVSLKKNTYYQLKWEVQSSADNQPVLVDLYGGGSYDEWQNDDYFELSNGDNDLHNIFYCDDSVPQNVNIRIISNLSSDLHVSDFELSEIKTK